MASSFDYYFETIEVQPGVSIEMPGYANLYGNPTSYEVENIFLKTDCNKKYLACENDFIYKFLEEFLLSNAEAQENIFTEFSQFIDNAPFKETGRPSRYFTWGRDP